MRVCGHFLPVLMLVWLHGYGVVAEDSKAPGLIATHKQIQTFKPTRDGNSVHLNTFCLDSQGNLLTCVSEHNSDGKSFLQTYSPELELIKQLELPFNATAINVAPDATIFVAGNGKIAKVSTAGDLSDPVDTPNIGDRASLKERLTKLAEQRSAQYEKAMQLQVGMIQERIDQIEEKEEEDRSTRDKKRLATLHEQKKVYEDSMRDYKTHMTNPDQLMRGAFSVTSLAVNSTELFVSCSSVESQGYEVWRTKLDFTEPERVLSGQSGCCGQFDIQADDQHLILAENTKFKVGFLDRNGKRISDFGQSNRMGGDGFGSCCNPMNVRCCANGDILTAESSIGTIKRYDKQGNLLAVVGKAKIGGGCKHVPLGYDAQRDRYYMQYQDRNAICILVPLAEAPEFTADELLAKQAKEGMGKKLIGKWSSDGKLPLPVEPSAREFTDGLSAEDENQDPFLMPMMDFQENGVLNTTLGQMEWECAKQADEALFVIMQMQGSPYDLKVKFSSDDEVSISVLMADQVYSTKNYKRVKDSIVSGIQVEKAIEKSDAQSDGGDQQ